MSNFAFLIKLLGILCLISTLGCQGRVKPSLELESRTEAPQANVEKPAETPKPLTLADRLLLQAQHAFKNGRYTTPSHDNAYDKFHSVLLIDPENKQARAGLQAILLQYSQLIRTALNEGRIKSAKHYLRQVEVFYPANALLMDLKKDIANAGAIEIKRDAKNRKLNVLVREEIPLSTDELSRKSDSIKHTLGEIAARLKTTDESILIFARSDREGRWIYKQLKAHSDGYRVRGDIRISRAPKITIMAPL